MNDSASAPASPQCPRCGAVLPAHAPEGLCPRCLAALPLGPETAFTGEPKPSVQPPIPPEALAPHFPHLEILECLGRGGMGVVYKARQKSLNRFVALKLLAPERASDSEFAQRFTREAHALAALNHPHIVTVYDFGQAGGFYFLLMEFVDGVNLRQAMGANRFTPEQALAVVPPICEALQYAHEHGIVHRDIKPENLLLDKEGRVKIADFGIAKILGDDSPVSAAESQPAGTPQYMAPEQKEHERTDHRADIYSLGVVLYEMLTGELPADKLEPPSTKVEIDVRLDEIVLRALKKEPELRFQTAGDFRTQLQTMVQSSSPIGSGAASANPPGTGQSPLLIFVALYGLFLCFLVKSSSDLPARMATHFDLAGTANGWLDRSSYLLSMAAVPLLMVVLFRLASQLAIWLPSALNIPRRDYWLAPERRAETAVLLWRWLLGLACLETLFFAGLHAMVAESAHTSPPHLPAGPMLGWTIGSLVVLMIWIVMLLMRLAEAGHHPPPSAAAMAPWPWFCAALGCDHAWSRWLAGLALLGFLGFLGRVPGWEGLLYFLWLFALGPIANFGEWLWRQTGAAPARRPLGVWPVFAVSVIMALAIALPARALLITLYVVRGDGAAPEIPAGSRIAVWRPSRTFASGDLLAYWHGADVYVGRFVSSDHGQVRVARNRGPNEIFPRTQAIGKVISVYWRGSGQSQNETAAEADNNAALGIVLAHQDGRMVIISLVPHTPASENGHLQPGDTLVGFSDREGAMLTVDGLTLSECVARLRGPDGSTVQLLVVPVGKTKNEAYSLTLTRRLVPLLEAYRLGQIAPAEPIPVERRITAGAARVLKKFTFDDKMISSDTGPIHNATETWGMVVSGSDRGVLTRELEELLKKHGEKDPEVIAQRKRLEARARLVSQPRVVRLYEVANPNVEDCTVLYRAKLLTRDLEGRAYLEMWCRFPGRGEAFSRGLDQPVSGSNDWVSCQIPFVLKKGEKPDLIRLNIVIEGEGEVYAKDIELSVATGLSPTGAGSRQDATPPLPDPPPAPATPPPAGAHIPPLGGSVALGAAVTALNENYHAAAVAAGESPLSEEEVVAAIQQSMKDRSKVLVTDDVFAELVRITETHVLPKGFELELLTGYEDEKKVSNVWSVRLRVPSLMGNGATTCIRIREVQLGTRIFGEEERKVIQAWREKEKAEGGIGSFESLKYQEERAAAAAKDAARQP